MDGNNNFLENLTSQIGIVVASIMTSWTVINIVHKILESRTKRDKDLIKEVASEVAENVCAKVIDRFLNGHIKGIEQQLERNEKDLDLIKRELLKK